MGMAINLTKDRQQAKDLLQDTFLMALEKKSYFDGENIGAWLNRLMRNHFVNKYRREQRIKRDTKAGPHQDQIVQNEFELISDFAEVARVIVLMPEILQTPIVLLTEEYSYGEIAEIVGCPEGTIKSRIFKARKQILKASGVQRPKPCSTRDKVRITKEYKFRNKNKAA